MMDIKIFNLFLLVMIIILVIICLYKKYKDYKYRITLNTKLYKFIMNNF